jgi:putative tricarboxylic transport membrane protein
MLMSGGDMSILVRSPITWFFWIATILTLLALTGAWGRITGLLRKG